MKERIISIMMLTICMDAVEVELVLPKGARIPSDVDYKENKHEVIIKVPGVFLRDMITGEILDRSKIDEFIASIGLDKIPADK